MNCPNCNNPLAPHQKFCDLCGTPVEQESVNAAPAFQEEFAPQEPTLPDTPSYGDDFVQQPQPPQPEAPVYTQQPVYAQPPQDQYQPQNYAQQQPQNPYQPPYNNVQQYGAQPPKKSNTPLIIVIIVLAVLLVGGGIFTAVMLLNKDKGDDKKGGETSQSAAVESGSSSSAQSSLSSDTSSSPSSSFGWDDSSSSRSRSSYSRDDSSSSSSRSSVPSGSHKVYGKSGSLLADDPAIDASDFSAESKIHSFVDENPGLADSVESGAAGMATADVYASGNALVYEVRMNMELDDSMRIAMKSALQSTEDTLKSSLKSSMAQMRSQIGVDNMVVVVAYCDSTGEPFMGIVID